MPKPKKTRQKTPEINQQVSAETGGQAKNIIQIAIHFAGSQPLATAIVIIACTFLIAGGAYWAWREKIKTLAQGEFVIMVEPFVLENSSGRLERTDLGDQIAAIFAGRLEKTAQTIFAEQDIDTHVLGSEWMRWIDWRPSRPDELDQLAEKRVDRYGTSIIVYGLYTQNDFGDITIEPRFYISPTDFGDAWEILGSYAIGEPVVIPSAFVSSARIGANRDLQNRLETLSAISQGLVAYSQDSFEMADAYLNQANQLAGSSELNAHSKTYVSQLINLLLGNVSARWGQSILVNGDLDSGFAELDRSEKYYNDVLSINSEYSRAYVGLASVIHYRALYLGQITGKLEDIDWGALEGEPVLLQRALDANDQPETADIAEKVSFQRAQLEVAYYTRDLQPEHIDKAKTYYQFVIDRYTETEALRLEELVSQSYSGLGLIARLEKHPEEAATSYEKALALSRFPSRKAMLYYFLGSTFDHDLNDREQAIRYYRLALQFERDLGKLMPEPQIDKIRQRVGELE